MPRRPPPPTAAVTHLPAPVGGLNTVSAGLTVPITDCVVAVNLMSAENGLRSRLGYREWCTNLVGDVSNEVRTIIPHSGSAVTSSGLFATTDDGIYNVGAATTTPTEMLAFSSSGGNAGYGVSASIVTTAGHFTLYADEVNGLHVYSESGSTWAEVGFGGGATQISGVDPGNIVFVTVFKNRVWLVERDTANAWYLPTGAIYGAATKFPMGGQFREGGHIIGLWDWTYDGGSGLDDSLVAVSSGGSVAVYQGTDPASPSTFALRGVWQIGAPPGGRHIATSYGGELLLLSRQGLVPMSRLVVGSNESELYATAKISNLINRLMLTKASERSWCVVPQPEDNSLLLLVPQSTDVDPVQLAQGVASRGWFSYRGLPMLSAAQHLGQLYFGTSDGRVCIHTGYIDNVPLGGSTYEPVDWSLVTGFTTMGTPRQKRVQMIRPIILAETGGTSGLSVAARYNYDQTEAEDAVFVAGSDDGTWDNAIWDEDVWSGDALPTAKVRGTVGMGPTVAIAIRGKAIGRTVLVGADVTYTQGGFL